jgi:hypothetical protein
MKAGLDLKDDLSRFQIITRQALAWTKELLDLKQIVEKLTKYSLICTLGKRGMTPISINIYR